MSENTKIEWADHTFNPWIGCTKVGPGCDNCYAKADFEDRKHRVVWGAGQARSRTSAANWALPLRWDKKAAIAQHAWSFGVEMHDGDEAACIAAGNIKPQRPKVFCASLADVFDNEVPTEWRMDLFKLISDTPNLDWLILTKRIGNVMSMCSGDSLMFDMICERVWLGVTVVNQTEADRDIIKLLRVPAAKRFVSIEPMLGPIRLWRLTALDYEEDSEGAEVYPLRGLYAVPDCDWDGPKLDWVIVGGESGPKARPMHPDWARSLRDQCQEAGVPFLFKQWGEWASAKGYPGHIPICHVFDDGYQMIRAGKKAAGRLLDGREWNGVPS